MKLEAKFIGQLDFIFNGHSITSLLSEKACGLLCYLIMNRNKVHYREHIANIFWENSRKDSANNNLRYALWILRKKLESDGQSQKFIINSNKNTIKFTNEDSFYEVDVFKFKSLIERAKKTHLDNNEKIHLMEEASKIYDGAFLEDFYINDAPAFNDWVFYEREDLQKQFFKLKMDLSIEYQKIKNYEKAAFHLNNLIKLNPLHEELYFNLMNLYYLSGNRAAAIETYRKLKKNLREELNISPMHKTQHLYNQICDENNSKIETQQFCTTKVHSTNLIGSMGTDENGISCKFFMVSTSTKLKELKSMLTNDILDDGCVMINIATLPGKRIPYEGIYEIIDELLDFLTNQNIQNNCFDEKLIDNFIKIKNTSPTQEYSFFQSIIKLLYELKDMKIIINIHNVHFLDEKTISFISFLLRKCSGLNLKIFGAYDSTWENPRFRLFEKAFETSDAIKFIYI